MKNGDVSRSFRQFMSHSTYVFNIIAWNSLFIMSSMGLSNFQVFQAKIKSSRKCFIPFYNWKICGFRFPLIAPLIKLDCNHSVRVINNFWGEASSFIMNWIVNSKQECKSNSAQSSCEQHQVVKHKHNGARDVLRQNQKWISLCFPHLSLYHIVAILIGALALSFHVEWKQIEMKACNSIGWRLSHWAVNCSYIKWKLRKNAARRLNCNS